MDQNWDTTNFISYIFNEIIIINVKAEFLVSSFHTNIN